MTDFSSSNISSEKDIRSNVNMESNNNSNNRDTPESNITSTSCSHSLHLLDNSFTPRPRSVSRESIMSSGSSSNSDTSEENELVNFEEEPGNGQNDEENENTQELDIRRLFRSLSDGQAGKILNQDVVDVFPNLPNSLLDILGLHGESPRERMSEEELEQKFVALALAFTIDAATIKSRCERQKRYRDQTETNLISEIDRLIEKANHLQPLCVDAETAELLTGLLAQIDVIVKAASHASSSSERFGAVQHEERLSEAVNLMINHVNILKQQRDSARKQLQYTKKMLQDTNSAETANARPRLSLCVNTNGKVLTKRRASIATISQPQDPSRSPVGVNSELRRITRRTSDLTSRVSAFARSSRPSRLELGVDLDKIKEGIVENGSAIYENIQRNQSEESQNEDEIEPNRDNISSNAVENTTELNILSLPFRQKILYKCKKFNENLQEKYEKYTHNSSLHEFFYFGAFLCFALGVIVLGNLLIEIRCGNLEWTEERQL